jgi:hypothetical protein
MDWWDIIDQFSTWNHLNRTIIGGDRNGYSQNVYLGRKGLTMLKQIMLYPNQVT